MDGLYRIILVDDEEEVRKGIIRKIDWQSLGFEVAGDAENGEEAMEKIEQLEPDVVMTDIRMPYMDGLTLCAKIRQKYPSMKILIFSGYDDFEYAQQAIKLNVAEYILKPVNVEELTEILNRVRVNLDEEIEQRRNLSSLRESYQSSLPILRELFLNDLVRGNVNQETIPDKLREYQVDIQGARKWVAAVIDARQAEGELAGHQELILISVRKFVEDHLKEYFRFTLFSSSTGLTMIAAIDEHNTQTALIDLLGDVCKEARKILGVTVTIGIGHSCVRLDDMGYACQSAVDALGYKAIVGDGKTIYINDMEPVNRGKLQFDSKDESELAAAIKFGGRDKIQKVVCGIMERMDEARVHQWQIQVYKFSLINALSRQMQQHDLNIVDIFGPEEKYMEMLSGACGKEELTEWVTQAACRISEAVNRERDNTARQVILDAKEYIQDHYQNPELSVEMICRRFHLSPAYFSTMFKKETGQTYVAFLTEVRLNHAMELLSQTDDKTYVIAQKVGYQEQNYFSYVFKKRFGVSPTRFRGTREENR